jgi:hypothetical protein
MPGRSRSALCGRGVCGEGLPSGWSERLAHRERRMVGRGHKQRGLGWMGLPSKGTDNLSVLVRTCSLSDPLCYS